MLFRSLWLENVCVANLAMNVTYTRILASALALLVIAPGVVLGQTVTPAPASPGPAPAAAAPVFSAEQLEQITSPIALYPDDLIAQILIASTYPLEVVQADRWASAPEHAQLKGEELSAALQEQTWDPSVKSLVPYPQVLKMMSEQLDWTQRLGDAFLAQQADVMASIQKLRQRAQSAGTLTSNSQQTVINQGDTVIVQPANPQVVYVPAYNPTVVYGPWPYPAYPPPYYPPPPAYYPAPGDALLTGMAFGLGVAAIASLSDCCHSDWHDGGGSVNINNNNYNSINSGNIRSGRATQLPANGRGDWRHDPAHRGGVAYRDQRSRQEFQRQARPVAATRDARGYGGAQGGLSQAAARPSVGTRPAQGAIGQGQPGVGGNRQPGGSIGGRVGASAPQARQQPAAFGGLSNGGQVRAQADRGRASRQSFQSSGGGRGGGGGGARSGGGGGGGGRGGGGRR